VVDDHLNMRVSDADRHATVERLRAALDEGRLKIDEYVERMGNAYEAVTYRDLAALCRDLPQAAVTRRPSQATPAAAAAPARPATVAEGGVFARLPAALKVLWTIWLVAVSVNVVVWVLASASTAHLLYPWPVWVAGPYGAVLLALSAAVSKGGRGHGPAAPPLPPGTGS
jgi:hypothetical protein